MSADWVATVAGWLAGRPRRQVPLSALGVLLRDVPRADRRDAASDVLAALDELDAAGLIRFAHLFPMAVIGVVSPDELRHLAETADRSR